MTGPNEPQDPPGGEQQPRDPWAPPQGGYGTPPSPAGSGNEPAAAWGAPAGEQPAQPWGQPAPQWGQQQTSGAAPAWGQQPAPGAATSPQGPSPQAPAWGTQPGAGAAPPQGWAAPGTTPGWGQPPQQGTTPGWGQPPAAGGQQWPPQQQQTPPAGWTPPGGGAAGSGTAPGWGQQPAGGAQWQPPTPAAGTPGRSKTPLILAGVGVLAVVALGTLGFALSGKLGATTLDSGAAEAGVTKVLTESYGAARVGDVSCPDGQRIESGHSFECTLTVDGQHRTVTLTFTDDTGTYEVSRPN